MLFAGPPLAELPPAPLLAEGPAPSPADPEDKQRAAEAFAEGEAHFAAAQYEQAADAFARADELISHPDTLYNLAVSLELAGDRPAAWMAYRRALAASPDRPRDMSLRLTKLTKSVGIIEFHSPATIACVDGEPMHAHHEHLESAVEPGAHELYVDGTTLEVEVQKGSTRAIHLDRAELVGGPPNPRARRTVGALSGLAAGTALLSTGLGIAAVVAAPNNRGFVIGATSGAAAAAGLSIAAIVVSQLARRDEETSVTWRDAEDGAATGEDVPPCPPVEG